MDCCEDFTRFLVAMYIFVVLFMLGFTFLCYHLEKRIDRVSKDLKTLKLDIMLKSEGVESNDDFKDLLED